jgi:Kef-type K+ transport system membrane component KefB
VRARYGASPVHLLAHLAGIALAGWALVQIPSLGNWQRVVVWLVAAVVVHDLVLWPAYSIAGRLVGRSPYVRVPLATSALLALVFFPVICGKGEAAYTRVSSATWDGYAERWLLVSALLFAVSGALYAVRSRT